MMIGVGLIELLLLALIGVFVVFVIMKGIGGGKRGASSDESMPVAHGMTLNCPHCGNETAADRPNCKKCGAEI